MGEEGIVAKDGGARKLINGEREERKGGKWLEPPRNMPKVPHGPQGGLPFHAKNRHDSLHALRTMQVFHPRSAKNYIT